MDTALKGIAFVTLRMNDFDQTVAFYTRLGLQQTYADADKTDVSFTFSPQGYSEDPTTAAYTDLFCSTNVAAPPPGETGIRIKLAETANLWEWVKQTQAQGVEFLTPEVVETNWVYEIKVKDPAGNILTIFK